MPLLSFLQRSFVIGGDAIVKFLTEKFLSGSKQMFCYSIFHTMVYCSLPKPGKNFISKLPLCYYRMFRSFASVVKVYNFRECPGIGCSLFKARRVVLMLFYFLFL